MNYNKAVCVFFGAVVGLVACGFGLTYYNEWTSRRLHAVEIEQAYAEQIMPAVTFIRGVVARAQRLPSEEEMRLSGLFVTPTGEFIHMHRERPSWLREWGVEGKDFLVETRVPEWNLYYRSWDDRRIKANWE